MKKVLSFAVAIALCGVFAACGDNNNDQDTNETDGIIILPDTIDNDVVVNPDADDRDDSVPVDTNVTPDEGIDTNVTPDEGIDTNVEDDIVVVDCYSGSCTQYWDCYSECPTGSEQEACVAECQGALSSSGQDDLETFNQCLYTTCGGVADEEAWYACIDENCQEAIIGCYWGCVYDSCDQMWGCYDGCPDDDTATTENEFYACVYDCQYDSSEQAQLDQAAMYDCAYAECPICETAETTAEEDECDACFNDATMGACWNDYKKCISSGTEYMTCTEFSICFSTCQYTAETQEAYDSCVDGCQNGVDADALHDRIVAENCSVAECPICNTAETDEENAQCNECWYSTMYGDGSTAGACDAEWAVCQGTTYDTCLDMYTCMNSCADYACYAECQGEAVLAARADYYYAQQCSLTACPICSTATTTAEEDECDTCWETSMTGDCVAEWELCLPEPGTDSCNTVYTCIGNCDDQPCGQACFNAGDTNAQTLYNGMITCLDTECPTWDQTCLDNAVNGGNCADEYAACTGDTVD